jgi:GDPmannose 4,6-dehydratase
VTPDPDLYRPAEVNLLRGDASKARRVLGWRHHTGFEELVKEMVDEDCRAVGIERAL